MSDQSFERSFLEQLSSEKRTLRVNAVVQLAKTAGSNEALKALQQLADGADRELSFYAAQAISRIRARRGDSSPEEQNTQTHQQGAAQADGPAITRTRLLSPQPSEVQCILTRIRSAPKSLPEELRPPAAAFFGRFGRENDVSFLAAWLDDPDSGLIVPVIEAIEALAPHALTAHFPRLLSSNHPIVRMRAISALQRIDPEEAEAHLSELLASRRGEERMAGLSLAFLFPFPKIREYLITILGEEQDPEVLRACEALLASNPEIDTTLRILDLIDTAPKPQAARLSAIFKTVCTSMATAGLVDGPEAPQEGIIKLWRRERLKKFLSDLEIQIAVATATRREAIEDWLAKNLQTPEVASFVEKLGQDPATEEVYRRLASFLPKKTAPVPSKEKVTPQQRSESDKLLLLAKIDKTGWEQHSQWVREEARFGPPALRAAAMQALATLSVDAGDLPLAETAIQQEDPDVQLAAFKLLELRAPEHLIPRLPALLASSAPKVRGRAIRFALKRDEKAAIQGIDWMLRSQDRTLRAQAVSCLFLFPFEKISDLVLLTLETEDHPAIARQLLVILLSNPSKDILDKLDKVQTTTSVGVSMLVAQARMDLFDILLKLGIDVQESAGTRSPACESGQSPALQAKTATKASRLAGSTQSPTSREIPATSATAVKAAVPIKPYSVAEVRQTIRNREAGQRPFAKKDESKQPLPQKPRDRLAGIALFATIIVALAFLPIMIPKSSEPVQPEEASKATGKGSRGQDERRSEEQIGRLSGIPATFRMGRPCKLTGTVVKMLDKQCFTFECEANLFRCTYPGSLPMMLNGEQISVEMLPYRKLPNGQIAAEVTGLTLPR